MPVCHHKRQDLTALVSEDDPCLYRFYYPKSVFQISISLLPLTSFIPSSSAASDLSTVCIGLSVPWQYLP